MPKQQTLLIEGTEIALHTRERDFYVNITDIARYRTEQQAGELVRNWLRARATVDFLGAWEKQFNPSFNYIGFDTIRNAMLIEDGMNRADRTEKLMRIAETEINALSAVKPVDDLKKL